MDWPNHKIKFELKEHGYTLSSAARECGLTLQTFSNTVTGRHKSPTADRFISETLGVEACEIWPSRYSVGEIPSVSKFEGLGKGLTDEQKAKLDGLKDRDDSNLSEYRRAWSRSKIEQAIRDQGFTDIRAIEHHEGLPVGSISQSSLRGSPIVDQTIAKIVGVPEWDIWPQRYWVGGQEIPKFIRVKMENGMSDHDYDRLRATMGETLIEQKNREREKNDDGTINHPFYDQPIYPDVPARADERTPVAEVSLPPGMIIDVK